MRHAKKEEERKRIANEIKSEDLQPNIRLGQHVPKEVRPPTPLQDPLHPIQRPKQRGNIPLIRLLRRRKPALVNAIVHQVVRPLARPVDFPPQRLGVQVHGGVGRGQLGVEHGAEHAQDLAALVVHDGAGHLVEEHGHGEPPGVRRVRAEVEVAQVREGLVAGHGVWDHVLAGGVGV